MSTCTPSPFRVEEPGGQPRESSCGDVSPAASETVRTEPQPYQCATRRFELRLTAAQLEAWRATAKRQGVSVADCVRFAMALLDDMPHEHVRAEHARLYKQRLASASADFAAAMQLGDTATVVDECSQLVDTRYDSRVLVEAAPVTGEKDSAYSPDTDFFWNWLTVDIVGSSPGGERS